MDWAQTWRIIKRGFQIGPGGGPPAVPPQPVSIDVQTPDYTMPMLALGGLGLILMLGPGGKRRRR